MSICRVYFHQATIGKPNQNIGKTHNYPGVQKVTQLVAMALVAKRKKRKLVKALTYFVNLKKKQQDQGGKNWCH